jgi:hypothetical protein
MALRPSRLRDMVIGQRGPTQGALQVQGDFIVTDVAGTEIMNLDVSGPTLTLSGVALGTVYDDSATLKFGTSDDITMGWDGTDFDVLQATENSSIKWGISGAGIDQLWYGDTAGANMTWDQSANSLIFGDAAKLVLGTGSDIAISWDGTDLDITQAAPGSVINVGVDGAGMDLKLFGDSASAYLLWDQSADALILSGGATLSEYRVRTITAAGAVGVTVDQSGGYFFATATATFTLPTVATAGQIYTFMNLTDANMIITSLTDAIIYKNDTFTTVTWSTANEKKGAIAQIVSNGTNWYLFEMSATSFAVGGTGS